jgi:hypothetical protein
MSELDPTIAFPNTIVHSALTILARNKNYKRSEIFNDRMLRAVVVKGNDENPNFAVISVGGTPPRGAVSFSLTHVGETVNRNIITGKTITIDDVHILRAFLCLVARVNNVMDVPPDFRYATRLPKYPLI